MTLLKLAAIVVLFVAGVSLAIVFFEKSKKRYLVALACVWIFGYILIAGAQIYSLMQSADVLALDYLIALVKSFSYTAGLLVFNDQFASLGVLTGSTWFKVVYYLFLASGYCLYSLTLLSFLSYKTLCILRLFFHKGGKAYAFTTLNDKSIHMAMSVHEKEPNALIVFALEQFAQTDENKKKALRLRQEKFYLYTARRHGDEKVFTDAFPLLKKHSLKVLCLDNASEVNLNLAKKFAADTDAEFYVLTGEEYAGSIYLKRKNVHVVKAHDLAAKMLMEKHPCFRTAYETETDKGINLVILGMGRTGNEVFKNAFIANQFRDIPLSVTILDRSDSRGFYRFKYPGLIGCDNIHYLKTDVYSAEFFDSLKDILKPNNYIVVTLGTDETNVEIANSVYEYLSKCDEIQADVYCHIRNEQNTALLHSVTNAGIHLEGFGNESEIFNYDVVIHEFLDTFAKCVNAAYGEGNPKQAKSWEELDEFTKESNRAVGLAIPSKLFSLSLTTADFADARPEADLQALPKALDLRAAQEEHMRWCAFHLVNGWTKLTIEEARRISSTQKTRKIPEKRKSLSLVSWEELCDVSAYLGEDVQSYDYFWKDAFLKALHSVGKKVVKNTEESTTEQA